LISEAETNGNLDFFESQNSADPEGVKSASPRATPWEVKPQFLSAPTGRYLEEVRTSSSKWIKTKGPEYKSFYWQNGFGAFSIGQSGVPPLKKYIAEQKELHRKKIFQKEKCFVPSLSFFFFLKHK
jgi:hypothetical protein